LKREIIELFVEDIDGEVLKRMPEWFRVLKECLEK
jgi:hypothetical protein